MRAQPYGDSMNTLSLDPAAHPRRRAALAAHALREALATAGLLEAFPECRGDVEKGRAVVRLGAVDAVAALSLAQKLAPHRRRAPKVPGSAP
jgi:hypothetical protein